MLIRLIIIIHWHPASLTQLSAPYKFVTLAGKSLSGTNRSRERMMTYIQSVSSSCKAAMERKGGGGGERCWYSSVEILSWGSVLSRVQLIL